MEFDLEFILFKNFFFFISDQTLRVSLFQSAAAAPSPVMGNMPPNDGMPGGPMPPGFFQVRAALSSPAPSSCSTSSFNPVR